MTEGMGQAAQFAALAEGQGMARGERFEAVEVVQFGEAPEPAPESAGRPPVEQYGAVAVGQDRHQRALLRQRLARLGLRIIGFAAEQVRAAAGDQRAKQATGLAARAEGGAEVHHRLGVVVDPCVRGEAFGGFPQRPGHLRFAGIAVLRQVARQYALDVAVEDRCAQAHRQAGDGSSGGAADAGQFGELLDVAGELPRMPLDHDLRGLVQVARTAVVAEPGPQVQDFVLGRRGQCLDVGNAAMKRSK